MLKIYGANDDLIEIEGDIEEEFNWYNSDDPCYLLFDDGTLVSVKYGKETAYDNLGIWEIKIEKECELFDHVEECNDEDEDAEICSDILYMYDNVKWVIQFEKIASARNK